MKKIWILLLGLLLGMLINKQWMHEITRTPVATLPDGGQYYGELLDGVLEGQGEIFWPNGMHFEGAFLNGEFHGMGNIALLNGESYRGEFKHGEITGFGQYTFNDDAHYNGELLNGLMHGSGTYVTGNTRYIGQFKQNLYEGHGILRLTEDSQYSGNFIAGQFSGQGHYTLGGSDYQGGFVSGNFHGKGAYSDDSGNQWIGLFENGNMQGQGEFLGDDGSFYRGEFEAWRYHGEGEHRTSEGDVYKGQFKYGNYHGEGIFTYNKPLDGIKEIDGTWSHGDLISDKNRPDFITEKSFNELLMYNQNALLAASFQKLEDNNKDKIDLYLLSVAGDGQQGVFRRESNFIKQYFDEHLGTKGKSMQLVNSRVTAKTIPQATVTSIERSINTIAARMDKQNDILFVYLTSHGNDDHELYLNQSSIDLNNLAANTLANMLSNIDVKWKVIVVSACYSGGFIPPLQDDNTLIITAAAADKTSFGCADNAEFTYFGKAFLQDTLPNSKSFVDAFDTAIELILEREIEQKVEPSLPQIHKPQAILAQLTRWRENIKNNTGNE